MQIPTRWLDRGVPRVALALLVSVAACSSDPVSVADLERAQARERWEAMGLTQYRVEARILCYCPLAMSVWHELSISSNQIVNLRALEQLPDESVAEPAWFSTVENVFDRLDNWRTMGKEWRFTATFDATTGLPTRVALRTPDEIADGGAVYEFRALKPGLAAP